MKFYRIVNGPVRIGPDMEVGLSTEQYNPRGNRVEIVRKEEGGFVIRPSEALDFKSGEIVGLSAEPPKHAVAMFEPVTTAQAKEWRDAQTNAEAKRKLDAKHAAEAKRAAEAQAKAKAEAREAEAKEKSASKAAKK